MYFALSLSLSALFWLLNLKGKLHDDSFDYCRYDDDDNGNDNDKKRTRVRL